MQNFRNIIEAKKYVEDWESHRASVRFKRAVLRLNGYTTRYELHFTQIELTQERQKKQPHIGIIRHLTHRVLCLRKQLIKESQRARQDSGRTL